MNKDTIKTNFSKRAATYDEHAVVQRECAYKLIEFLPDKAVSRVLELGCGTGVYTGLLREKYPQAEIVAIDISQKMLETAEKRLEGKNITLINADAETYEVIGEFDLVTSNASFQWLSGLDGVLGRISKRARPGGHLVFSVYGPGTFFELDEVLCRKLGGGPWIDAKSFLSCDELNAMMKRHFVGHKLVEKRFNVEYQSLTDFMRSVKLSGATGGGLAGKVFFGKKLASEIEEIYRQRFNGIKVTHEVFFCKGAL